MKIMKGWMMVAMWMGSISSAVTAGTITKSTEAPTGFFASGVPNAPSFTRIFANGARPTDTNEGRGNEIISDSSTLAGGTMTALVLRKDGDGGTPATGTQDFTGSTAFLTLYVFEGTKEMWDAGDGQGDGDPFDGTGITTIYTETFALNDSYAEGDYITLTLETPVTMAADMGFFVKLDKGDSSHTFFQIAQLNSSFPLSDQDGYQYQAPATGNLNFYTASPLEYYAVGTLLPPPSSAFAITGISYDNGSVTLQVKGAPNTTYNVKASATLADGFPDLVGTVITDGSGDGTFGPFSGVGSAEFYRLETQ